MHTQRRPLYNGLWLWEERISYLWACLHRLLKISWAWAWQYHLSSFVQGQHLTQDTTLTTLISSTPHLTSAVCEGINCFPFSLHKSFLFTGVPCHRQIKMRKGVLVLKNASMFTKKCRLDLIPIIIYLIWMKYIFLYELIFSASMEMYGLRIAIWAQAPVWNMTNARTPFPTTFWDATITLTHSHPTSLWENVSISKMATDSVWLDVSKHAERLVLCLRDWGF